MAQNHKLIKANLFFLLWKLFRQEIWHQKIYWSRKTCFSCFVNCSGKRYGTKNWLIKENLFFLLWKMFRQEIWNKKLTDKANLFFLLWKLFRQEIWHRKINWSRKTYFSCFVNCSGNRYGTKKLIGQGKLIFPAWETIQTRDMCTMLIEDCIT